MWANMKDSINVFFSFFPNFFKIGKIVKVMIKTLCCWVYNIYRCNIYDKIAQKRERIYIGMKFL